MRRARPGKGRGTGALPLGAPGLPGGQDAHEPGPGYRASAGGTRGARVTDKESGTAASGSGRARCRSGLLERASPRQTSTVPETSATRALPPRAWEASGGAAHRAGLVESLSAPYSVATPSGAPWHTRHPTRASWTA